MQTEQEARDASGIFTARVQEHGPIQVGDYLDESPCRSDAELEHPDSPWQREGRPCPRVELPWDLTAEARLVHMLNEGSPHTAAFLLSRPRRRRRRLFDRACEVLASPAVQAAFRAQRAAVEATAAGKD